jgi:hypothetical protein
MSRRRSIGFLLLVTIAVLSGSTVLAQESAQAEVDASGDVHVEETTEDDGAAAAAEAAAKAAEDEASRAAADAAEQVCQSTAHDNEL